MEGNNGWQLIMHISEVDSVKIILISESRGLPERHLCVKNGLRFVVVVYIWKQHLNNYWDLKQQECHNCTYLTNASRRIYDTSIWEESFCFGHCCWADVLDLRKVYIIWECLTLCYLYVGWQFQEELYAPSAWCRSSSSKSLLYVSFWHKWSFKWHCNTIKNVAVNWWDEWCTDDDVRVGW